MLILVSNFRNFCSASPSFWQSVCKHNVFFSIRAHGTLNKLLYMIERKKKLSETDAASQKDTTRTSKAITTMNSFQRCTTQQHSTNPPFVTAPEGFPHSTQSTDAQQPAATRNKSHQNGVHNRNPYINSPSHNPIPKDRQERGKRSLKGSSEKEDKEGG